MSEWTYCTGCDTAIMGQDGSWVPARGGDDPKVCPATGDGLHTPGSRLKPVAVTP